MPKKTSLQPKVPVKKPKVSFEKQSGKIPALKEVTVSVDSASSESSSDERETAPKGDDKKLPIARPAGSCDRDSINKANRLHQQITNDGKKSNRLDEYEPSSELSSDSSCEQSFGNVSVRSDKKAKG